MNVTHSPADVQERSGAWLTVKDLQQELQIGERLAYKLIKRGDVPSVRVGGLIRIYRPQLEEALLDDPDFGKEKAGSPQPGQINNPLPKESPYDSTIR